MLVGLLLLAYYDVQRNKTDSLTVLEKRIEALLRRGKPNYNGELWVYGDTKVDFSGYSATYKDSEVDIKPKGIYETCLM